MCGAPHLAMNIECSCSVTRISILVLDLHNTYYSTLHTTILSHKMEKKLLVGSVELLRISHICIGISIGIGISIVKNVSVNL